MRGDASNTWTDPSSFATTLLMLYYDALGDEGLYWGAETIALEVEGEFGVKPSDATLGRLYTAIRIITTDEFFHSCPDFVRSCVVLSGGTVMPGVWQPADALECAWGITEALFLWPPDSEEPFTKEVRKYVGAVCDREGLVNPPDVLRMGISGREPGYEITPDAKELDEFKAGEIVENLRDSMDRLATQLEGLPLENGSAVDLVGRLRRHTRKKG